MPALVHKKGTTFYRLEMYMLKSQQSVLLSCFVSGPKSNNCTTNQVNYGIKLPVRLLELA